VLEVLPALIAGGGQLAVLGSGDHALEAGIAAAAQAHPQRVGAVIGYDEPLSHLLQAGADAILVPSRFEPCGLTQMIGLRYGTIPIVARTGGLADTIIDANVAALRQEAATGLQFAPTTASALAAALERALRLYRDRRTWQAMQRRAMLQDVGWGASARAYLELYGALCTRAVGEQGGAAIETAAAARETDE
jgi:starch synthase